MDITWNAKAKLKLRRTIRYPKKNKNDVFKLSFGIRWVIGDAHWTIDVSKIAPNDFQHWTNVNWG